MTVEDIYRITSLTQDVEMCRISSPTQDVEMYNPKSKDFVYIGECGNIPVSCMDIPVSHIFTNNDILVIIVK